MKNIIPLLLLVAITLLRNSFAGQLDVNPSPIASVTGLKVSVAPFQTGQFSFSGGDLEVVANGTWFVGVDLYRKTLISLPRIGHRGWVPVVKVVAGASEISEVQQIIPDLPSSRIPRSIKKIRDGQPLNVVVMGSSLAEGTDVGRWSGMLFNNSSSLAAYKVPNIGTFANVALGGSPNQFILSQLGYAWPNGQSSLIDNIDLVVLTCLANGGEYRLQIIESVVRRLKKRGVEVILLTDNPQNPTTTYAGMLSSGLYPDGNEVMRIANTYGIELADTAAYVFEQPLRNGSGIYSDSIHMKGGGASGPSVDRPLGGHEVYARAVRSIIPLSSQIGVTAVTNANFNDGVQGFTSYRAAFVTPYNGKLKVLKTNGITDQWGCWVDIPAVKKGDSVRVQGTWSFEEGYSERNISIGTQGGGAGWGSTVRTLVPGSFDQTVTLSRDIASGGKLLFYGNNDPAPINAAFSLDNIVITLNPIPVVVDMIPGRAEEVTPLPPVHVFADPKTPVNAIITLPKDESYSKNSDAARGTLGSHPSGANSFARRFFSSAGPADDLLTLTSGQKAVVNGISAVGFSLIRYGRSTDSPINVEIRRNTILLKTLNLSAGYDREEFTPILTPTQYGQLPPINNDRIELTVISGELRICALVALTADNAAPITYWAAGQGVFGLNAMPTAAPFGDGVSNLLKFAFNIPLDGPRNNELDPAGGLGSSGMPVFSINSAGSGQIFRSKFLRRRNSGLSYFPQRSINMVDFIPMLAPLVITPIDAEWELVTVDEVLGTPAPSTFFSRLQVTLP